jgi:hypothetical protein
MSSVLEKFLVELDKQIKAESEVVAKGHCATFEDYKRRCGKIDGLLTAQRMLRDLWIKTPKEERL